MADQAVRAAARGRDTVTAANRWSGPRTVAIVAVAAFAVVRLAAFTRYPLWMDEAWTMDVGVGTLRQVLRQHADDQSHPPLFFALLWAWRRVGTDALEWVRLLPALMGIATAIPMLALARAAKFSPRAINLSIVLGAGSGFLVSYSAELRNYALLALLAAASLALWLRARDEEARPRRWVALTIVNVLLVYTHYFGVFIVVAEWLDAVGWARRRFRGMTASAAITAASLAPWIYETVRRAGLTGQRLENVSWITVPVPGDVLDVVTITLGSTGAPVVDLVVAVVVIAAIALWAWRVRGTPHGAGARLLALAVVIPVAVALVGSLVGPRSLWVTRYFIAAAPPLLLLVAATIDGLVPARLSPLAFALAAVPASFTAWSLKRGTEKPRFDVIAHQVADFEPAGAAVIFTDESSAMVYAVRAEAPRFSRPVSVRGIPGIGRVRPDSGWYFWNETRPPVGLPPAAQLVRNGYRVGPEFTVRSDNDSLVAIRFRKSARIP